jgi:hypothetical protein
MTTTIEIDAEVLYQQHQRLIGITDLLEDLIAETGLQEGEMLARIKTLTEQALEQVEEILDSEASRVAMEDVRAHGAVPWEEIDEEFRP